MDLTWISVIDTAVKIGLGAAISGLTGYLVLIKKQSHEDQKEERANFYKLQEEKKSKYVEFLSLSQALIQTHLFDSCSPSSDEYKSYLRVFNELQIISSDQMRLEAFETISSVQSFIFLNKNQQEQQIVDGMVSTAREKTSNFQKAAQLEVTRCYQAT
ncbi:hypothetical protein QC823_07615 [Halomonas vilamensis]|uniref:Uncharacterized protein n=1 Tax=Vreelandella vilamensis TaxID=531309 RepID=A0ABU1H3Q2_9GAMM|nr:hypothetical protein [Halomonas vilamensis]MDR5898854.1 hypothetical protein [Halomonas vilamensis]